MCLFHFKQFQRGSSSFRCLFLSLLDSTVRSRRNLQPWERKKNKLVLNYVFVFSSRKREHYKSWGYFCWGAANVEKFELKCSPGPFGAGLQTSGHSESWTKFWWWTLRPPVLSNDDTFSTVATLPTGNRQNQGDWVSCRFYAQLRDRSQRNTFRCENDHMILQTNNETKETGRVRAKFPQTPAFRGGRIHPNIDTDLKNLLCNISIQASGYRCVSSALCTGACTDILRVRCSRTEKGIAGYLWDRHTAYIHCYWACWF